MYKRARSINGTAIPMNEKVNSVTYDLVTVAPDPPESGILLYNLGGELNYVDSSGTIFALQGGGGGGGGEVVGTAQINTNSSDINDLKQDDAALQTQISSNQTAIDTNTTSIGTNTTAIDTKLDLTGGRLVAQLNLGPGL